MLIPRAVKEEKGLGARDFVPVSGWEAKTDVRVGWVGGAGGDSTVLRAGDACCFVVVLNFVCLRVRSGPGSDSDGSRDSLHVDVGGARCGTRSGIGATRLGAGRAVQ
jgi:hypothetical protein